MIINRIQAGTFNVNTYVAACPETRQAAVIDPAGDGELIFFRIERMNVRIRYILNTHGHADHVEANRVLKDAFSVPTCMHKADDDFFSDPYGEKSNKVSGLLPPDRADMRLADGDVLKLGGLEIQVIHTPGHTPGSVCFYSEGNLFTGDTLFVGDVGRTDIEGGALDALLRSLETKLIGLPEDTVVWPGHDYGDSPSSTIGREMRTNPYITDFILDKAFRQQGQD